MSTAARLVPLETPAVRVATGRMPALDGLRALSIALVLLGHVSGTAGFPHNRLERFIGDYANLGVTMFFVISGFLITNLLVNEHEEMGNISLRLFYARRILRLFPAFLLFVATLIAIDWIGWIQLNAGDVRSALTYTVNFRTGTSWYIGHLWSLSVEEQFYLLWPATLVFAGLSGARWIAVAMILISPVARFVAARYHLPGAMFPCVADSLAFGCLLALMDRFLRARSWYSRLIAAPALVPVAAMLILACNWSRQYVVGILFALPVISALMSLVVHHCVYVDSSVSRFLKRRPLVWIGILSYSLYLWQQVFLNRNSPWTVCEFPLNLALALAAAAVSYTCVERPLNEYRKRLRRRPELKERGRRERLSGTLSARAQNYT